MVVLDVRPVYDACSSLANFVKSFCPEVFAGSRGVGRGVVALPDGSFKVFLGPGFPSFHRTAVDGIIFHNGMCWVVCCFVIGHMQLIYTGGYLH